MEDLTEEEQSRITPAPSPMPLQTANGLIVADKLVELWSYDFGRWLTFYVLPNSSPAVLSMGMLCKDEGYKFDWQPFSHRPSLSSPDGKHKVLCDTTEENTPTIGGIRFKMVAAGSEADADSEPEAQDPID